MIVVCTPTGQIGRQVLGHVLDAASSAVRVIARDPFRLPARVRERTEVVQGSLTDAKVLGRALEGASSVFWLLPPDPHASSVDGHRLDFTRPLRAAITRAGRLVYVTGLGNRQLAGPSTDQMIRDTGVSLRALPCPAFMDNLLQQIGPITEHGVFGYPASGEHKLPACAIRDIATVAAELLLDPSWTGQDRIPILGPEDISYNDMARVLTEELGRPVHYQQVPGDVFKATLTEHGVTESMAQWLVDRMAAVDEGLYDAEPRTPRSTTPTSFRQWCRNVLKPAVAARAAR